MLHLGIVLLKAASRRSSSMNGKTLFNDRVRNDEKLSKDNKLNKIFKEVT